MLFDRFLLFLQVAFGRLLPVVVVVVFSSHLTSKLDWPGKCTDTQVESRFLVHLQSVIAIAIAITNSLILLFWFRVNEYCSRLLARLARVVTRLVVEGASGCKAG